MTNVVGRDFLKGEFLLAPDRLLDPKTAGGKAFALKRLVDLDLPVMPFFCISAECFRYCLCENGLLPGRLLPPLEKAIHSYLDDFFPGVQSFSVRSSAVGEDASYASYAGQFRTFLRVSRNEVCRAVADCWTAALADENISLYQQKKDPGKGVLSMGVIVQQMLEADVSGVAFSANPQGILNESVVVCGHSTGDNVVEDKSPVTTYYYNHHDKLLYYEKNTGAPSLSGDLLEELLRVLEILGKEYPVDVEFAVKDGILCFFQCRPITTLQESIPSILDNSNISESYPGLSLPLTASFVKYVYFQVFSGLARHCLPDEKTLREYEPVLRQMVEAVNGRMYYRISNWYALLQFLPFQKKIIPVWQQMLGVANKEYDLWRNKISWIQKQCCYGKILKSAFGIPRKMDKLNQRFSGIVDFFEKNFTQELSSQELKGLFDSLCDAVIKDWDITLLNDLYTFIFTGLLQRRLQKAGFSDYKQRCNLFLARVANPESIQPVRDTLEMALELSGIPVLLKQMACFENDADVYAYLAKKTPFANRIRQYLHHYGDRCPEELKLETVTYRRSPLSYIRLLLSYADSPQELEKAVRAFSDFPNTNSKNELSGLADLLEKGTYLQKRCIVYFAKKAAKGIENREISRLNRGRLFGMAREIFLTLGENLFGDGILEEPEDVLYLSMEEAFFRSRFPAESASDSEGSAGNVETEVLDLRKRVQIRKREYEGFAVLPPYSRMVFAGDVFNKNPSVLGKRMQGDKDMSFCGTPCSAGTVKGEVVIVDSPAEAKDTKGKILVTKMTDPGWVFLLATAKGVIAEKGSLLSHTAIIARELGVPSVVGISDITQHLRTGDIVQMDGGTGHVTVCE